MGNIAFEIKVKCERCGKVGSDHDIPTTTFPDGSERTLCQDCADYRGNAKKELTE